MTEELKQALQQMIQQQLAQTQPQPPLPEQAQPVQTPQKFVFAGQEWDSKEAAEAAAAEWYKRQEAKLRELEAKAQTVQQPPAVQQPQQAPQFDQTRYFELLTKDPVEAQRMAMRQMLFNNADARDPNGNPIDPALFLRNTIITAHTSAERLAELEMRANHPEVPWTDPDVLRKIEEMRVARNLPANAHGRELAIESLQARQLLPTRYHYEQQAAQSQQQPPQNVRSMPTRPAQPWETQRPQPAAQIPTGGAQAGDMGVEDFEQYMLSLDPIQAKAMRDAIRQQAARGA